MGIEFTEQNWIINKLEERVSGNFDQAHADLIVDVALHSPATLLGLEIGDYLVSINGARASTIDLMSVLVDASENVNYKFYSHKKHSYIEVTTTKIPLGIHTESSTAGILDRCRREGFIGWTFLETLWSRRNWAALLEASKLVAANGPINRLIRLFSKDFRKSAEVLFTGAALYEQGEPEAGIELIAWFINKDIANHETSLHAIAYFYAAKWAELNDDNEGNKRWLSEANRSNGGHFERIAQEVYLKGYELPLTQYNWTGKPFPLDYSFRILDQPDSISLNETLNNMDSIQLLPICVMPAYRANGPYNDAMLCYRSIYAFVADRIRPMQIILDTTEKRADRLWWYEQEEAAIDTGIPLSLLHDSERTTAECLALEVSPVFYLINNKGDIKYEGPLIRPIDYWHALSKI